MAIAMISTNIILLPDNSRGLIKNIQKIVHREQFIDYLKRENAMMPYLRFRIKSSDSKE